MQESESFMLFEDGVDDFINQLCVSLRMSTDVHLLKRSTPQNLMSVEFRKSSSALQLRFSVLGVSKEHLLGRLSWLDENGIDHVCCYVNEFFKCVERKKNGRWCEQKYTPDEFCSRCLLELTDS